MTSYIIRRLLLGIVVLLVASVIIFSMMRLLPGDPLQLYIGNAYASYDAQTLQAFRHEYHLDKPVVEQYFYWMGGVVRGDLGQSITFQEPVSHMLAQRLPITLNLAALAVMISTIVGPTLGVIAAIRRNRWQDNVISVMANLGITVPVFWIGIMLILVFSYKLHWLPTYGYTSPFSDFVLHLKKLIMPVFCLSIFGIASQTRQTRASILEVSHQDYIRTAWAKGLKERVVVTRHVVKNGLIPVLTVMGLQVSFLFGGSVLVETVFNIPGIGSMMTQGIANRDYQVVQGVVLVMAVIIVLTNILVDVAYAWVDPRIRHSYQ